MITLSSHKKFQERVKTSQATAALFIYSDKKQAREHYEPAVKSIGKRNCQFKAVQMNDIHPGRNRGKDLPSVAAVSEIIKFFALHHDEDVVICDIRGKGLSVSSAIIARFIHHKAARKAVKEVMHEHSKGTSNGFMLRVADAILNSSLAAAAESFGRSHYVQFTPSAYRAEVEDERIQREKKAEEASAAKREADKAKKSQGNASKASTAPGKNSPAESPQDTK